MTHLGCQEIREAFAVEPYHHDDGHCCVDLNDVTMDVVDWVSLSCEGVDEHPSASRYCCLGNLGNRDGL